jgi:biotin carboxyl carrier protein
MIPIPSCTVVTAPVDGRVRRLADEGTDVIAGDVVAMVESGGRDVEIRSPKGGRIAGALAALTQPVTAGDGVLWLARA